MKRPVRWSWIWLWLLLALAGLVGPGCKTPGDTENRSERPWNQPKGWETGLPSSLWDRRY